MASENKAKKERKRPPPLSVSSDQSDSQIGKGDSPRVISSAGVNMDLQPIRQSLDSMEIDDQEKKSVVSFLVKKSRFMEFKTINPGDFERLAALGQGHVGSVFKVRHIHSKLIVAEKTLRLEVKKEVRDRIIRELRVLHKCSSPHIVGFFGSFWHEGEIHILMEYMDGGSLDVVLQRIGRIEEPVIAVITSKVVEGLLYLDRDLKVMHRDIKPSNILVNSDGAVKLCDFGVSGELQGSLANSFVGTRSYMAPERLKGEEYSVASDVWSLGISLIELATGHFPIPPENLSQLVPIRPPPETSDRMATKPQGSEMVVFELLTRIVEGDSPQLPADAGFSEDFCNFVESCTRKEPKSRLSLSSLLSLPFINDKEKLDKIEMAGWVQSTMIKSELKERLREKRDTPSGTLSSE
eukprot:gene2687-5577_t